MTDKSSLKSLENFTSKNPQKIQQKILRLKALLNQEKTRLKKEASIPRRLRTRTLIQTGGLLQKAGLLEMCAIDLGEDLQEYPNLDKAALLLGFLKYCSDEIPLTEKNKEEWRSLGEKMLKYNFRASHTPFST